LGLGASSNQIQLYIWHKGYTSTHVLCHIAYALHVLVPLGPSFLNSLNAYDSSEYPLDMLPEKI